MRLGRQQTMKGTINCRNEIIYVGLIIQMVNYIYFCMALKLLSVYTTKNILRSNLLNDFYFRFFATNWILSKLTIETSKVAEK